MIETIQSFVRYRAIDQLIREKGSASLDDLAEFCRSETGDQNISGAMIEDDIKNMKESDPPGYNAPLFLDKNKEVYSYVEPGYSLNSLPLTQLEASLLDQSVLFLSQLKDHSSLRGLKGMIQKITDSLRIRYMSGNRGSFDFVHSEIPHSFGGSKFLQPLIKAIKDKFVLRIYYQPFYEDKPYFTIVHPYLLKEYKNRWYLIGLNDTRQELRTYGLDRIWELQETDQEYIPRKFSASSYFKNTIGVISPMGDPPEIKISVSRHQANYLITQPVHESQYIESENEDRVIFSYRVHPTYEFKSQVLSMGADARVLSPESLRKDILRQLNDAILEYGKPEE